MTSASSTASTYTISLFFRWFQRIAILITLSTFVIEFGYFKRHERETQSWHLLTTEAPGNSGKINALEHLSHQIAPGWLAFLPFTKERRPLYGIEILPPMLAELRKQGSELPNLENGCQQFTFLQKVQLPFAILTDSIFLCSDLRHANLNRAHLQRSDLRWTQLQGAVLWKANMLQADLRWTDLQSADLRSADLQFADLRSANLERADLRWADLRRADLRGADLRWADLRWAKLEFAKMQGAKLEWTKLWKANLSSTELRGANLNFASLWGADLRGVKGIGCFELRKTTSWSHAFRDETLKCNKAYPPPPRTNATLEEASYYLLVMF